MPPKLSSARKKGKTIAKTQAQQDEELRDLSRKVGLSSSDKDKASEVSVTLLDVSPLASLQAKDGTTPTPLQQWLQEGDKRVQPEKVGLKSPQVSGGPIIREKWFSPHTTPPQLHIPPEQGCSHQRMWRPWRGLVR